MTGTIAITAKELGIKRGMTMTGIYKDKPRLGKIVDIINGDKSIVVKIDEKNHRTMTIAEIIELTVN